MLAASNRNPAHVTAETDLCREVFLPLGEAMLVDFERDLLCWAMASDRIRERARRYNAKMKEKLERLFPAP